MQWTDLGLSPDLSITARLQCSRDLASIAYLFMRHEVDVASCRLPLGGGPAGFDPFRKQPISPRGQRFSPYLVLGGPQVWLSERGPVTAASSPTGLHESFTVRSAALMV